MQPTLVSARNSKREGVARSSRKRRRTEGALGDSHSQPFSTLYLIRLISGVQRRHLISRWWRVCRSPLPLHQHLSLGTRPTHAGVWMRGGSWTGRRFHLDNNKEAF